MPKKTYELGYNNNIDIPGIPTDVVLTVEANNTCGYPTCIEINQINDLKALPGKCGLQLGCVSGSSIGSGDYSKTYHNILDITTGCNFYDRVLVGRYDLRIILKAGNNVINFANSCDTAGLKATLSVIYSTSLLPKPPLPPLPPPPLPRKRQRRRSSACKG